MNIGVDFYDFAMGAGWARRPLDADGNPLCRCGVPIGERELSCARCSAEAKEAHRAQRLEATIKEDLEYARKSIPSWSWARARDHSMSSGCLTVVFAQQQLGSRRANRY